MSLKYKEKASLESGTIDWRKICEEDEQCKLYNKYLLELASHNMVYYTFCEAILCAGLENNIMTSLCTLALSTSSKPTSRPT